MLVNMAYLGVKTPAVDQWPAFAEGVLGLQPTEPGPDGALRYKVDDVAWRIQVHPNPVDDLGYFGWAVTSAESLDVLADKLKGAGVEPHEGDAELLENRCAARIVWFLDPFGGRHELVFGQSTYPRSFRPSRPISGFKTGEQGLGHIVYMVPDLWAADDFFRNVLGFKLSDRVSIGGFGARFFHLTGRHHTLAIAQTPNPKPGLNHLMLEVNDITSVGTGYDLARDGGYMITSEIGQHANDRMFSFYVKSPSLFNFEYGWGGIEVDDETWMPYTYHQNSLWGHRRPEAAANAAPGVFLQD